MTAKRDSKRKPKKSERPKLKKETVKDLTPDKRAGVVRGGGVRANCDFGTCDESF